MFLVFSSFEKPQEFKVDSIFEWWGLSLWKDEIKNEKKRKFWLDW